MLQAIVALGFAGAALLGFLKAFHFGQNSLQAAAVRSDILSIASTIQVHTDCSNSFVAGSTCPSASGYLPVLKSDGSVLISPSGTKFGKLTVRAICNADNSGIDIQGALLKPTGTINSTASADFVYDSSRGIPYDWNHPNIRFTSLGLSTCTSYIPPPPLIPTGPNPPGTVVSSTRRGKGSPPCFDSAVEWPNCPRLGSTCQSGKTYFYYGTGATSAKTCSCICR